MERAAWEWHSRSRDELTVRGPTLSALEPPRCEGLAITSYALVLQGVD
jgi:hypothetical protein